MIKKTIEKTKQTAGKLQTAAKWTLIAYLTLSVAYTSLTIAGVDNLTIAGVPVYAESNTAHQWAGELDYKEWREQRAEWLQTQDSFQEYLESEALDAVNMKVQEEAQGHYNVRNHGTTSPANL